MAKKSNEKTINVLPTCSPHSAIHQIADDYAAFRRKETKAHIIMAAPVRTHSQLKINSARNSFFKRVFFAHPAPPCRPRKGAKKRANRNRPSHANNLPARKRPTSADTNETEAEKKEADRRPGGGGGGRRGTRRKNWAKKCARCARICCCNCNR